MYAGVCNIYINSILIPVFNAQSQYCGVATDRERVDICTAAFLKYPVTTAKNGSVRAAR